MGFGARGMALPPHVNTSVILGKLLDLSVFRHFTCKTASHDSVSRVTLESKRENAHKAHGTEAGPAVSAVISGFGVHHMWNTQHVFGLCPVWTILPLFSAFNKRLTQDRPPGFTSRYSFPLPAPHTNPKKSLLSVFPFRGILHIFLY